MSDYGAGALMNNALTGLDEEFMRERGVSEPPGFLHRLIGGPSNMLARAACGRVATPEALKGLRTLTVTLHRHWDSDSVVRLLRENDWLPTSAIRWSDSSTQGTISCMHRHDRRQWAQERFYPMDF